MQTTGKMPKPTPRPISPTILEYTLGIEPEPPQPRVKPPKKSFTSAGLSTVMWTMIAAGRPMRFHEIVKANLSFANSNGLQKAARELVRRGKLNCTRDKDGNIYSL